MRSKIKNLVNFKNAKSQEWLEQAVIESSLLLRSLQQLVMCNGDDAKLVKLEEQSRKLLVELRKLEKLSTTEG